MKVTVIKPLFIDNRGEIIRLMELPSSGIVSVLYITSKKGAIRANHYHKKDTHHTYLLSGKFEYMEKPLSNSNKTKARVIVPGELVTTRPQHIHAMKFLEDSEMIVFTTEPRSHKKYEKDTVRVSLI